MEEELRKTAVVANEWYSKKLKIAIVRWILTIILYVWLWHKWWWVKWTLIPLAPLILFNLYHLTIGRKKIMAKFEEVQARLHEVQDFEEE